MSSNNSVSFSSPPKQEIVPQEIDQCDSLENSLLCEDGGFVGGIEHYNILDEQCNSSNGNYCQQSSVNNCAFVCNTDQIQSGPDINGCSQGTGNCLFKQSSVVDVQKKCKKQPLLLHSAGKGIGIPVRHTNASLKRIEKFQQEQQKRFETLQQSANYQTPFQRKEAEVVELQGQINELCFLAQQREHDFDAIVHERDEEFEKCIRNKDEIIKELEVTVEVLEGDLVAQRSTNAEDSARIEQLEEEVKLLRQQMVEKECKAQEWFLEMYQKGRTSEKLERMDEIERIALETPNNVSKEELMQKLKQTQLELERWQSFTLSSHYNEAKDLVDNIQNSATKLKFLGDSMFHFITNDKQEVIDMHLQAMINLLNFSTVQMQAIQKSLAEKRKKKRL